MSNLVALVPLVIFLALALAVSLVVRHRAHAAGGVAPRWPFCRLFEARILPRPRLPRRRRCLGAPEPFCFFSAAPCPLAGACATCLFDEAVLSLKAPAAF